MNVKFILLSITCFCSLLKAHEAGFLLREKSLDHSQRIHSAGSKKKEQAFTPENINAPESSPPTANNDTVAISTECYLNNGTVDINVLSNDSDPNGDINPYSVLLINPSNPAQTGITFNIANTGNWRTNGNQVSFTAAAGFFGQAEISYQICDSGGRCVTAKIILQLGTRGGKGCYPGSEWRVSRADSILAITSSNFINPGGMLGYSNYDTLDATTYAIISANTSNTAVLDFGTAISPPNSDSIRIIWASATQGSNSGIKLEYSLNNSAYTLWSGSVITNKKLPATETAYPIPAAGLRYIKITYSSGVTPLIDAVHAEKWACSPAALSAENDDISMFEDNPVQINVLKNDIFPEKGNADITIVASPRIGKISVNPDKTITYLNNTDIPTGTGGNAANGLDTFSYKVCDKYGFCDTAQVFVTIINDRCGSGDYKPTQLIYKTLTILGNNANMIDTYLDKDKPDVNYGANTSFDIGLTQKEYRALIKYNVRLLRDSIPANAVIDSAQFSIFRTGGAATNLIYSIHRLTRIWTETGATWNRSNGTTLWTTPGGDFASNRTSAILSTPVNGYKNFEIKRLIQTWITTGSTDTFGFQVKQSTNPLENSLHTFQSSEGTSTKVPRLVVYYSVNNASCAPNINRAPMANPDYANMSTEDSVVINPLLNDADPDNNNIVIASVREISGLKGTASFSGSNIIYKPNFSITAPRTDTLIYRMNDGLLFDSAYIFIKIRFRVNAGIDRTLCSSKDTIRLAGKTPGNFANCQWTSSGSGQFSNTTIPNPVYTISNSDRNLTSLSFILRSSSAESGCVSVSDTVNFTIEKQPEVQAGGPDSVCTSSTPAAIALTGSSLINANQGTWSIISGTGNLSSTSPQTNPASVNFTPASGFSGNVKLRLTSNNTAICNSSFSERNLFIKPILQIISNPTSQSICFGNNDTLKVTVNAASSSFNWFSSSDGTTWTSMSDGGGYSGTSSDALKCNALPLSSSTLQFKVRISNSAACLSPVESAPVSLKFKNLWLGDINTNWDNALNWSDLTLPGSSCPEVYIMGNRPNQPVISNTTSLAKIKVMDNGLLTVNGRLKISGNITTEGSGKIKASEGTIELNGSSSQTISGSSLWQRKIKNLVINNPAGVNISNTTGDTLNLTGKLSFGNVNNSVLNTGNNLTITSNQSGTASVADLTNNGANSGNSITGNVTVERYITRARKWQFLSIPTNTIQNFRQSWMEGANSGSENPRPGFGTLITDNRSNWQTLGFDALSPGGPSVKLYNPINGNYNAIPSTSENINTAYGYMAYVRGDRTAAPSNQVSNPTILRTTGPLKQGIQAAINIPDSAFVAIGNPYASTIDMGRISKPNCFNNFYIWDPALSGSHNVGGFQTFAAFLDSTYYPIPGGGSYGINLDPYNQIQSGQAFFVRGGIGGVIQLKETAKMPDSNRLVMRPSRPTIGIIRPNLYSFSNNTQILEDGVGIFFSPKLSNGEGPEDGLKMRNPGVNVAVSIYGKQYAVDGRKSLNEKDTFLLHISGLRQSTYEWNIDMQNMKAPGRIAFLVDNYLASRTRLNLEGSNPYRFTVTQEQASSDPGRFLIVFKQPSKPTLEFIHFTGKPNENRVDLSWKVTNETGYWKYEIERAKDEEELIKLAENKQESSGNGISEYSFTDNDPSPGINSYRIKAVDAFGNTVYSKKILISDIKAGNFACIRPNPVVGKLIRIHFTQPLSGQYRIELTDNTGVMIHSGEYSLLPGSRELILKKPEKLAAGIYFLKISGSRKKLQAALKVVIP